MEQETKQSLQITKEIVVKFIETGRISPSNFQEIFPAIFNVVQDTVVNAPTKKEDEMSAVIKTGTST